MKKTVSVLIQLILLITSITTGLDFALSPVVASASSVDVWWPTNNAQVTGTQPFKAMVPGLDVSQYQMYWQVDGGQLNVMQDNYTNYQHKEVSVDVSGWNWHGSGPYTVNFVAQQNGVTIAQQSETIYITNGVASLPQTPTVVQPATTTTQPVVASVSPTTTAQPVVSAPQPSTPIPPTNTNTINVWWPTNNAQVTGTQPFKAMVPGLDVSQYQMYWQVDGGQLNVMQDNYTNYQHKEVSVDVSGWNWHGSGPYTVNFVAQQNGVTIAQQSETIYITNGVASLPQTPTVVQPATTTAPVSSISNMNSFYVNPNSDAALQAQTWTTTNPTGAAAMQVLAAQPTAVWLGDWNTNVANDTRAVMQAAAAQGKTPVFVAYNIPERDCGGFSSGGSNNPAGYTAWIQALASGIGSGKAVIILEPDALAQISCLSSADQNTRLQLLSQAVTTLKSNPNAAVYIDAGHSGWIAPNTMAQELTQAGIAHADGFSLNVSNFYTTADQITYGQQISALTGNKHFVIDTSRNGNGSNGQWCNPSGAAIGTKPTTQTGNALVDAFLWIKTPGESDGTCNGGPAAGVWWPSYALQLVQNAH